MSPTLTTETAAASPTALDAAPHQGHLPGRPASRRQYLAAGAVLLGGLAAGLALTGGPSAHAVTGTVQLWQSSTAGEFDARCTGRGADADIAAGAPVRITDGSGEVMASGTLSRGRSDGAACVFGFAVPQLAEAGGYRVAVGDGSRPAATFTYRDMHTSAWDIRVVIGA